MLWFMQCQWAFTEFLFVLFVKRMKKIVIFFIFWFIHLVNQFVSQFTIKYCKCDQTVIISVAVVKILTMECRLFSYQVTPVFDASAVTGVAAKISIVRTEPSKKFVAYILYVTVLQP